jgi:hypothetical protein
VSPLIVVATRVVNLSLDLNASEIENGAFHV